MKKKKLTSLALLGISLGLLTNGCNKATGAQLSSEMQRFYDELTPDAKKKFMELDEGHKRMAMQIVDEYCRGENECKGHREQAVEEQYDHQMKERQDMNGKMEPS